VNTIAQVTARGRLTANDINLLFMVGMAASSSVDYERFARPG